MANRNMLWSEIFVDELARSGLKGVCAAPGSRHTPLMLAFAKHPDIKVYSHLDERSASFFALGLALASDAPVALICTSGTAGANMYPAIIEAHQSRVPLIVITADRPAEARHSGANQTIDQIKMFGDFVLWFVDMALPEANPPALAIRNLRTTANRAYAKANGIRKGVVHINMPFRKPLEPIPVEGDILDVSAGRLDNQPFVSTFIPRELEGDYSAYRTNMNLDNDLEELLKQHPNGLIVCGTGLRDDDESTFAHQMAYLSGTTGYPVVVDGTSDIRFSTVLMPISTHETVLAGKSPFWQPPQIIIQFGNMPTSRWLEEFIASNPPEHYLYVAAHGEWADSNYLTTRYIQGTAYDFAWYFSDKKPIVNSEWKKRIITLENETWKVIDHKIGTGEYFDGAVVYDVVDLIPFRSTLFVGNSLPVRHLDQFGKPQDKRIYTYANRGASGIDGNISSALGAGAARPDKPLVAIVGDITFYHDMNGLLAVHRCGVPITIVLLNNDGGGIFNRLPIKNFEPEFTDYFLTPHGLDFSHAAKMYGLDYILVDAYSDGARDTFRQAFSERVGSGQSTIIEVRTDGRKDETRRQEIVAAVHARLKELNA
jgi:2-succinyl-5-enolpyruvyl-6-hydroxy-3-cyclohexene-1-carboxylate synthase